MLCSLNLNPNVNFIKLLNFDLPNRDRDPASLNNSLGLAHHHQRAKTMSRPPATGCCIPLTALAQPVQVAQLSDSNGRDDGDGGDDAQPLASAAVAPSSAFFAWPLLGPLLFDNEMSDARNHCANERTLLSYLRLAVYMAVLSVAITLTFHLTREPSDLERRMAKPLGLVFWLLSVATLLVGLGNYITTVNKYGRRAAIVQSGWRTQLFLALLALCIIGTCVILIVVPKLRPGQD